MAPLDCYSNSYFEPLLPAVIARFFSTLPQWLPVRTPFIAEQALNSACEQIYRQVTSSRIGTA